MATYRAVSATMENMGFLSRMAASGEQVYYGAYSKIAGEDKQAIEEIAPNSVFSNFNYSLAVFSKEDAQAVLENPDILESLQKYHVNVSAEATREIISEVETSRRNFGELMAEVTGEEIDPDVLYYNSLSSIVTYDATQIPEKPSNDMIAEAAQEMEVLKNAGLQPDAEMANASLKGVKADSEKAR